MVPISTLKLNNKHGKNPKSRKPTEDMTVKNIAVYNLLYFTQSFGDTTESSVFPTDYSFVPTEIITIVGRLRLEQFYTGGTR